jgi:hypothetical protein
MPHLSRKAVSLLMGICLSTIWVYSQVPQNGQKQNGNTVVRATPAPSQTGPRIISTDGPSLGANFIGTDIKSLVATIRNSPASKPKSEFETTEQYERRVGSFKDPGKLSFRLLNEVDGTPNVDISYDADHQILSIEVMASLIFLTESTGVEPGFLLNRARLSISQYVGSNSFGIKKLITKADYAEYGVLLATPARVFDLSGSQFDKNAQAHFELQVPVTDARHLKLTLRAVLVCNIDKPAIVEAFQGVTPTISSPFETNTSQFLVPVNPRELILYDSSTGRVVARRTGIFGSESKSQEPTQSGDVRGGDKEPEFSGGVFRVGGGVSQPAVIYKVDPEYSEEARTAKYSGTVQLQFVVDVDGKAKSIKVVKGVGLGVLSHTR